MWLASDHYLERLLEGLIKACSVRSGPQWQPNCHPSTQLWNHLLSLLRTENKSYFLSQWSCYDSRASILRREMQRQPSLQLAVMLLCVLWTLRRDSLMCLELPCLSTEGPTRKIKVLFAFTRAGSCSEAECQAAESGTAAWPCAEQAEINDTVYSVWFGLLWHLF